jgi:hypothetical protein
MLLHEIEHILALKQEGNLLGLDEFLVILPCPAAFLDPRNVHRVDPEILLLALSIHSAEGLPHHLLEGFTLEPVVVDGELFYFLDDEILLTLDDVTDARVIDGGVHIALHHGAALVVLDVSFPAFGRHAAILAEALLPKVSEGQVVSIGHQVLHFSPLHFL